MGWQRALLVCLTSGCVATRVRDVATPHLGLKVSDSELTIRITNCARFASAHATLNGRPMHLIENGGPDELKKRLEGRADLPCTGPTWSGRFQPGEAFDVRIVDETGEWHWSAAASVVERRWHIARRQTGDVIQDGATWTPTRGGELLQLELSHLDDNVVEASVSISNEPSLDALQFDGGRASVHVPEHATRVRVRASVIQASRCEGTRQPKCSLAPRNCIDCRHEHAEWSAEVNKEDGGVASQPAP